MGETQLNQASLGSNTYVYGGITFGIEQQPETSPTLPDRITCPGST